MKPHDQKRIVIVDGYSTGRDLVRELVDRNVECLHLRSTEQLPAAVANSFNPAPYDADLGYVGEAGAAIDMLTPLAPNAVVAGSEWGVTFAEQIAHGMGLPTNRVEMASARRNKFDMIEAARRHGLRVAQQASVSNVGAAHEWAARHAKWPIVVKPMSSAGSDGVSICGNHAGIDAAFVRALGRENYIGCLNERLLMQSFLAGPQYIVNTVSRGGRHFVTDAWFMTIAAPPSLMPQDIQLLDPVVPTTQALIKYTFGVLGALGIENGAAHTELKWTPEGPALIETGARVMGAAMDSPSYRDAGMESQAMAYARILAGSDAECNAVFAKRHYGLRRHITKLLFNFRRTGQVRGIDGLVRLRRLRSFNAHYRPLRIGDRVRQTADWLCTGGVVYLIHDDPHQIAADIDVIRTWEQRGELYALADLDTTIGARS
jgi:hypothetical protein